MEKYFNTKGLSEYIATPEQTIRRWVLNNEIPYFRVHGVIRYRASDIDKWFDEHKEKAPAVLNKKQENELFNEPAETEDVDNVEEILENETAGSGVEE